MSKEAPIYLVIGEAGAYSNYSCWGVRAFTDLKKAVRYTSLCKKHVPKTDSPDDFWVTKNPYDPKMKVSWSYGTSYRVEEVQLAS